ncbi:hypothetical protein L1049_013471 [Liquidambar formosana]|uniref:Uncharacterized protein n=1 Tax=Liquidambar formosana TaxID=63359 RepID=A0AAP0WU43_LIQFO
MKTCRFQWFCFSESKQKTETQNINLMFLEYGRLGKIFKNNFSRGSQTCFPCCFLSFFYFYFYLYFPTLRTENCLWNTEPNKTLFYQDASFCMRYLFPAFINYFLGMKPANWETNTGGEWL